VDGVPLEITRDCFLQSMASTSSIGESVVSTNPSLQAADLTAAGSPKNYADVLLTTKCPAGILHMIFLKAGTKVYLCGGIGYIQLFFDDIPAGFTPLP